MNTLWNMNKTRVISLLTIFFTTIAAYSGDSIPDMTDSSLIWSIGAETTPGYVIGTNRFLRGDNPTESKINATLGADAKVAFRFNPSSRKGILYPGLYQGLGIGMNTFFHHNLLGTPISVYAFQGAPIVNFTDRLSLNYEWQFGAALGWNTDRRQTIENQDPVSTRVTAHMGLGFKLRYQLTKRTDIYAGISARHYSNGNTSWPNKGVNSIGISVGADYYLSPSEIQHKGAGQDAMNTTEQEHNRRWEYDAMVFGAWRKRVYVIDNTPQVLPGKFGIAGLRISALRRLNRFVTVGPAIETQWDEGAGLDGKWVNGSYGENIKFYRPSFGRQLSIGGAAHAELTMPIFTIDAGVGYDFIKPKGERRFYQSLSLKTYLTDHLYLNVGYRLGRFRDPQNLMLGIGVRL